MAPPITREQRARKIASLLDKARDPAVTEEEARSYAQHAAKLMARHRIDEASIQAVRAGDGEIGEQLTTIDPRLQYTHELCVLLSCIADALHCQAILLRPRHRNTETNQVLLLGSAAELDRVRTLFELISVQARLELASADIPWYELEVDRFRRSWLIAFASKIKRRLREIERVEAQAYDRERPSADGAPSMELALTDSQRKVNDYLAATYPDLPREEIEHDLLETGTMMGIRAAARADIGLKGLGS